MEIFRARLARVQAMMDPDGILVVPSAPPAIRNRDTHYSYRAHSDTIYLAGVNEEELSLIILKDAVHVFAQVRDPERERWVGRVRGHEFYLERFGRHTSAAHEPGAFEKKFSELIQGKKILYYDFGQYPELDRVLFKALNDAANYSRRGITAPRVISRASEILHACRLKKDAFDLDNMRAAAKISSAAHNRAQDLIEQAPGSLSEFEVKALIEHEFMRSGADRLAYPSIVAAGANATVLHYEGTDGMAKQGDFILIDAGAELNGYASDITRTTLVGGKARGSALQKELYEITLAAQRAAIGKTRTGATIDDVHHAAIDVLAQGLLDTGFFEKVPLRKKGEKPDPATLTRLSSLDEVKELEYYNLFYMHRTSHYLGLDVHDVGDYFVSGKSRPLEPGMVITVEPGLYFPEEYDFIRPEARGIGIRIEDDVLVTDSGNEVLTSACRS